MLLGKYVVSPIDNKEYCRKNGQFLRHIQQYGYTYQTLYETLNPDKIKICSCGKKCVFIQSKMSYKQTCGTKECVNNVVSSMRQHRSLEEWENWKEKYKTTMSLKSREEIENTIEQRRLVGHSNGSYKASVVKREKTCEERYGDKKYNNSNQISQTKQAWDEERKQLFLQRLKLGLGNKTLNDFHTQEMFIARRKMLEERGDIIPLEQLTNWEKYQKSVRNLTEQTYRKHKDIINPDNLTRGICKKNVDVYQLDHIVPIFYGFQNNIPAELLASLDNLCMLHWQQNASKGKKYDTTTNTKHKQLEN